jgi:hypothetical protein
MRIVRAFLLGAKSWHGPCNIPYPHAENCGNQQQVTLLKAMQKLCGFDKTLAKTSALAWARRMPLWLG